MCGIVYAHYFDGQPVNNDVIQQFDKQRSRGTQGFGLFDGQEMHLVRAASENKILKWLVKYNSNLIMFHHRFPTSTINVKKAAHPFATKDYFDDDQYVMVHNGVISNASELYAEHTKQGIKYQSRLDDGTFNDSEALLWDLALTLEGKQAKLTARGSIAFVCMKLNKGKLDKLYFGRNSSPLNLRRTAEGIGLSSEGEGEPIDDDTLYTFNYKLKRLTTRAFDIPSYATFYPAPYSPHYGGYDSRPYANDDYWDYDRDGNVLRYDDDSDYVSTYISKSEVERVALTYLAEANGNFEDAYWIVEDDYEELLGGYDPASTEGAVLLERVMEYIMGDPEYVDENSISSLWEASWAKL